MTSTTDKPLAGLRVLLIEDMASLRMVYRSILIHAGAEVRVAATAAEARASFRERPVPVVVLDVTLPDGDGLDLMHELRGLRGAPRFVVITAHGGVSRAVLAMQAGAHDFLVKPFEGDRLVTATRGAAQSLQGPGRRPRAIAEGMGAMVGSSAAMTAAATTIAATAASMAPVLVTGGPGTGKDLCARMLHALSGRAGGPFLRVDCRSPAAEVERALFAEDGAFYAQTEGTLYLSNLAALPLALQRRLYLVLHMGSDFAATAGPRRPSGRMRIVVGVTGSPEVALRERLLDRDLMGMLGTLRIDLPPLRDRGRDVIEIALAALAHFGLQTGKTFEGLSEPVEELFLHLPWPANVREVLNLMRQIVLVAPGGQVTLDMLPERLVPPVLRGLDTTPIPSLPIRSRLAALSDMAPVNDQVGAVHAFRGMTLAEIERAAIEAAIEQAEGSLPRAAKALGIAPSTLYRKRQAWGDATG